MFDKCCALQILFILQVGHNEKHCLLKISLKLLYASQLGIYLCKTFNRIYIYIIFYINNLNNDIKILYVIYILFPRVPYLKSNENRNFDRCNYNCGGLPYYLKVVTLYFDFLFGQHI